MYKLTFKGQLVDGFDSDQVIGNLAQLLQLKPKVVRMLFGADDARVIKLLESGSEVERWCVAFQDAGVYLDVAAVKLDDVDRVASQIELELELYQLEDDEDDFPALRVKKTPVEEAIRHQSLSAAPASSISSSQVASSANEILAPLANDDLLPITIVNDATTDVSPAAAVDDVLMPEDESTIADMPPTLTSAPEPIEQHKLVSLSETDLPAHLAPEDVEELPDYSYTPEQYEDDSSFDHAARMAHEEDALLSAENALEPEFHSPFFVWGMLLILVAVLGTAGFIYWHKTTHFRPMTVSAVDPSTINALATHSLYGVVHADLKQLSELSGRSELDRFPAPLTALWHDLRAEGINVDDEIVHYWAGAYGEAGSSKVLWVLEGTFTPELWRAALKKNYAIRSDDVKSIIFSDVDPTSCELASPQSASISAQRIVIGSPELVGMFISRAEANAPAEKPIQPWAEQQAKQVVSAVLFQPGQLPDGRAAMLLGRVNIAAEPIDAIQAGLVVKTFPPSVEWKAQLLSQDPAFADSAHSTLTALVNDALQRYSTNWPELSAFYQNLSIGRDGQAITAQVKLDNRAPDTLQTWLRSLYLDTQHMDAPVAVMEERIDVAPPTFSAITEDALPSFQTTQQFDETFIAQVSRGPFGLGVRSLEKEGQGTRINIAVHAYNLPNVGNRSNPAMMTIKDIVDHRDTTLIKSNGDGCAIALAKPAPINLRYRGNTMVNNEVVGFDAVQGSKRLQLPDGVAAMQIAAIKGVIQQPLATNVDTLSLSQPFAGQTIERNGLTIKFLAAEANRLLIHVTGDQTALLHIGGLNAQGQPLAMQKTVSKDSWIDGGETLVMDFQGTLASAEVVIATALEPQEYEFNLARVYPPAKPFESEPETITPLSTAQLKALDNVSAPSIAQYPYQSPTQVITAGPIHLAVNQVSVSSSGHLSLATDAYAVADAPIANQISTVRLMFTELEDRDGNIHSIDVQAPIYLRETTLHQGDMAVPLLSGPVELKNKALITPHVVALWGKVKIVGVDDVIPIVQQFHAAFEWVSNGSHIKLQRWEPGRLIFEVDGPIPELVGLRALDENGRTISQPAEVKTTLGTFTIELEISKTPEQVEFTLARGQTTTEFPLELRVNPSL